VQNPSEGVNFSQERAKFSQEGIKVLQEGFKTLQEGSIFSQERVKSLQEGSDSCRKGKNLAGQHKIRITIDVFCCNLRFFIHNFSKLTTILFDFVV